MVCLDRTDIYLLLTVSSFKVSVLFTSHLTLWISTPSRRHSQRSSIIFDIIAITILQLKAQASFMICGKFSKSSHPKMQRGISSMLVTFDLVPSSSSSSSCSFLLAWWQIQYYNYGWILCTDLFLDLCANMKTKNRSRKMLRVLHVQTYEGSL